MPHTAEERISYLERGNENTEKRLDKIDNNIEEIKEDINSLNTQMRVVNQKNEDTLNGLQESISGIQKTLDVLTEQCGNTKRLGERIGELEKLRDLYSQQNIERKKERRTNIITLTIAMISAVAGIAATVLSAILPIVLK